MDKITKPDETSSPLWHQLEIYAREHIQEFVQKLLEEEVDDLLGRKKSARQTPASPGGLSESLRQTAPAGGHE